MLQGSMAAGCAPTHRALAGQVSRNAKSQRFVPHGAGTTVLHDGCASPDSRLLHLCLYKPARSAPTAAVLMDRGCPSTAQR